MKGWIAVVALLVLTAGCATVPKPKGNWVKDNVTEEQQRKDVYECKRDMARIFWGATVWTPNSPVGELYAECLQARGYHFRENRE